MATTQSLRQRAISFEFPTNNGMAYLWRTPKALSTDKVGSDQCGAYLSYALLYHCLRFWTKLDGICGLVGDALLLSALCHGNGQESIYGYYRWKILLPTAWPKMKNHPGWPKSSSLVTTWTSFTLCIVIQSLRKGFPMNSLVWIQRLSMVDQFLISYSYPLFSLVILIPNNYDNSASLRLWILLITARSRPVWWLRGVWQELPREGLAPRCNLPTAIQIRGKGSFLA